MPVERSRQGIRAQGQGRLQKEEARSAQCALSVRLKELKFIWSYYDWRAIDPWWWPIAAVIASAATVSCFLGAHLHDPRHDGTAHCLQCGKQLK